MKSSIRRSAVVRAFSLDVFMVFGKAIRKFEWKFIGDLLLPGCHRRDCH
jgi:hypothetical protein